MRELRPTWTVTTPRGAALAAEYDTLRGRWRVDPGGYERRRLADALAQATAATASGDWIVETAQRLTVEAGHVVPARPLAALDPRPTFRSGRDRVDP